VNDAEGEEKSRGIRGKLKVAFRSRSKNTGDGLECLVVSLDENTGPRENALQIAKYRELIIKRERVRKHDDGRIECRRRAV
jgi:hypothetical protein